MTSLASSSDLPGAGVPYTGPDVSVVPPAGAASLSASAVSWGAIFAGAAGAAALSLILLLLGTGLGLSSASAFSSQGASAATLGMAGILWITFTQLAASGMGGYLAGRLRSRWTAVHTDEVYFRDTAHGFLAWAVATLVTAAFLASSVSAIVGTGAQAVGSAAGGVATAGAAAAAGAGAGAARSSGSSSGMPGAGDATGYFVDSLFRPDMNAAAAPAATAPATSATSTTPADPAAPAAAAVPSTGMAASAGPSTATVQTNAATSAEVSRIMASALRAGNLPQDDAKYVGRLVAQRTGMSQADAEKRVNDVFAKAQAKIRDTEAAAREAADKARKTSAHAALWLFISLLVGAFVASFAATYGGRRRDL